LVTVFSFVAIFIGCLGLFGLISFMANQKTKEVGIRKVLGASVESIVYLFSKEFIKLIVIGFLLAAPVSALVMNEFLKEFAYRIDLNPLIFIAALSFTFLIAIATVGFKSFRAAAADPAKSLRTE
jgi:putative ABC transport system permease protein